MIENKQESVLSVEDLEVGYDDTVVLSGVKTEVPRGKITVILGESGCGKSTLLKNILLLYRPKSGKVLLFGKDIINMEWEEFQEMLLRVGVLFQSGGLIRSLSVYENLSIPLRQHSSLPEAIIRQIVKTRLRMVELHGVEDLLPAELSGGMQKRAGIARALTTDPELLFFDEPTAGLDPITARSLDRLILRLNRQLNTTLVIVSHHMASIRRIADRLIFLARGAVLFQGSLEEAETSDIPEVRAFFDVEAKCEDI